MFVKKSPPNVIHDVPNMINTEIETQIFSVLRGHLYQILVGGFNPFEKY